MSKQRLSPSKTAPQFVVIFPNEEFVDWLAQAAKANERSINGEIIERLYASFKNPSASAEATRIQMLRVELDIHANRLLEFAKFLNPGQTKPTHTRWVNIYKGGSLTPAPGMYVSKEKADEGLGRIACIEISYTEGEGL